MNLLFCFLFIFTIGQVVANNSFNDTSTLKVDDIIKNHSQELENDSSLLSRYKFLRYIVLPKLRSDNSECGASAEDYPTFISASILEKGGIIVVFLIGIYCFTLLALICDGYFLPCVERICEAFHLSQDVAAATFMSIATSTPELFVNIIGTFVTETDIGIGTIVGSSLFNTLGVASLGGLAASNPIQLHWWPVTRDVIIYVCAVVILISITWDGIIYWYEGLILFIVYFFYFTVMFQNVRISKFFAKLLNRNKVSYISDNSDNGKVVPNEHVSVSVISHYGSYMEYNPNDRVDTKVLEIESSRNEEVSSLFEWPQGSLFQKILFLYTWPLKFILLCTIPNPKTHPKLFPITFLLCIFWIGSNSYMVSWMIALIGNMFRIPDAVLGLTFLAAGGCLPEAISITIMSRRGEGSMGVSNSLGANTMNILLSLGMPWFLKTILKGTNDQAFITLDSNSIEYTISGLVVVAMILYFTLYFHKFKLSRRVGIILLIVYTVCIILAILAEMVFFRSAKCNPGD